MEHRRHYHGAHSQQLQIEYYLMFLCVVVEGVDVNDAKGCHRKLKGSLLVIMENMELDALRSFVRVYYLKNVVEHHYQSYLSALFSGEPNKKMQLLKQTTESLNNYIHLHCLITYSHTLWHK